MRRMQVRELVDQLYDDQSAPLEAHGLWLTAQLVVVTSQARRIDVLWTNSCLQHSTNFHQVLWALLTWQNMCVRSANWSYIHWRSKLVNSRNTLSLLYPDLSKLVPLLQLQVFNQGKFNHLPSPQVPVPTAFKFTHHPVFMNYLLQYPISKHAPVHLHLQVHLCKHQLQQHQEQVLGGVQEEHFLVVP